MPAPTNIDFASATDLGTVLPVTITQEADFAGTTYSLYYKRVVQPGETEWSVFGYGDAMTYKPATSARDASHALIQSGGQNLCILLSVTERIGETIYLVVDPNGVNPAPANLTLNIELGADATVPNGSIAVNDDSTGGPQVYYSTSGAVLRFRAPYPNSDFNDTLPSGFVMAFDLDSDAWSLFGPTGALVNHPAVGSGFRRVTSNQVDRFYLGNVATGVVKTVDTAGVVGPDSWTVTGVGNMQAIAPSTDDTILYVVDDGNNKPIKRWDLVNDMALADLAAGIANYKAPQTMIVLANNGSVIAGYQKTTATVDYKILNYSAAGATLHTYNFGTTQLHQMNHALDDSVSFWVWLFNSDATFEFREVKISDGSTLATFPAQDYSGGVYQGTATATPVRFGNSGSCQFYVTRTTIQNTTTFTIRRQRRFLLPSSQDNKFMQIPTIEILMRTGIGLTPDAWGSDANSPQGANPQVMTRISKDGGKTWSPERWISAGKIGEYLTRVRLLRATGNYRNAVFEITTSDPVSYQFLAAIGSPVEGSS